MVSGSGEGVAAVSDVRSRMAMFSALSLLGSVDMQMPISDGPMYRVEYPRQRSISKTERQERKAKKKQASKSKKRNR